MKKVLVSFVVLCLLAFVASADSYTYTKAVTNGQPATLSDQIPVSGYLDKIELSTDLGAAATCTVVVATYTVNSNAVETYATKAVGAATVIRPRFLATDNTGTAIATTTNTGTATATMLIANYEKPLVGGNLRISTAGTLSGATTNNLTCTIYYEPKQR